MQITWPKLDPTLSGTFALGIIISVLGMKLWSYLAYRRNPEREFAPADVARWAATPLMSIQSWKKAAPVTAKSISRLAVRAMIAGLFFCATFSTYFRIAPLLSTLVWPYLAAIPAMLIGETLGPVLIIAYSPLGRLIQDHHRLPFLSANISEFWGARWNTWMSDWFRQVLFEPFRKRPVLGSAFVFAFSGIWHEAVINVPYLWIRGSSFLGSMVTYFAIQFVAVLLDRRYLFHSSTSIRRAFCWLMVLGPAPLVLNEPVLRMAGLWPG